MTSEEELFDKYISATMTADEREALKVLLRNEESGQRFCEYIEDTGLYISMAEDLQMQHKFEQRKSLRVTKKRITQSNIKVGEVKKPIPFVKKIAAVAAIFVIGSLVFLSVLTTKNSIGLTGAESAAISIERAMFDFGWTKNNVLMSGDIITALENDVKLILDDGSKLILDQGASCQISKNEHGFDVKQSRGLVEYDIEKQQLGRNFEIYTKGVRTTVIGTRFTIEANGNKEKVRVLEGLVKVDNYKDVAHFVNPGEFALKDSKDSLTKAMALMGMKLNEIVLGSKDDVDQSESLEERPYILAFYAEKWDPSSRIFVHKLKDFYEQYNHSFEVVFVNDKNLFAQDYEMPWPLIKNDSLDEAESILGLKKSSFPLNVVLIDQHGTTLARSVANNEWLGVEHVLDAIKSNAIK